VTHWSHYFSPLNSPPDMPARWRPATEYDAPRTPGETHAAKDGGPDTGAMPFIITWLHQPARIKHLSIHKKAITLEKLSAILIMALVQGMTCQNCAPLSGTNGYAFNRTHSKQAAQSDLWHRIQGHSGGNPHPLPEKQARLGWLGRKRDAPADRIATRWLQAGSRMVKMRIAGYNVGTQRSPR